jgi:Amidohydrolase
MGDVTVGPEKNAADAGKKKMKGKSSGRAKLRAIDLHAHVIVPEVYALAAQHNVFSELPTDPGVTDEMRRNIKERAATVLARMSDNTERIGNMDAMGVDVQVLSASLVHQGLEWADAQTSLRLARMTNDWIAKAVALHPARLIGLGTLPLHVPALAVSELERCVRELGLKGGRRSRPPPDRWSSGMRSYGRSGARRKGSMPSFSSIPAAIVTAASNASSPEQRRTSIRGGNGDLVVDV